MGYYLSTPIPPLPEGRGGIGVILMKNGEKYLRQGLVDRLVLKQVKDDEVTVEMKEGHSYQLNSLLDRYTDYFLKVLYSQYFNPERKPEHFPLLTYQIYAELLANSD